MQCFEEWKIMREHHSMNRRSEISLYCTVLVQECSAHKSWNISGLSFIRANCCGVNEAAKQIGNGRWLPNRKEPENGWALGLSEKTGAIPQIGTRAAQTNFVLRALPFINYQILSPRKMITTWSNIDTHKQIESNGGHKGLAQVACAPKLPLR